MFGPLRQEFALTSPQRVFKALNLIQIRLSNLPKSAPLIATLKTQITHRFEHMIKRALHAHPGHRGHTLQDFQQPDNVFGKNY